MIHHLVRVIDPPPREWRWTKLFTSTWPKIHTGNFEKHSVYQIVNEETFGLLSPYSPRGNAGQLQTADYNFWDYTTYGGDDRNIIHAIDIFLRIPTDFFKFEISY